MTSATAASFGRMSYPLDSAVEDVQLSRADDRADEEIATAEAMRVMSNWSMNDDTQCRSIDIGDSNRYRCTITYSPRADL